MLSLFSSIYSGVTSLRNHAFDRGWRKIQKVPCPVVSVGNITAGGTGKTPFIEHLIAWSRTVGLKPGVVSRGYGGRFSGVQKVDLQSGTYYGDEPMMLASRHPEVPIYVCGDRVLAASELLANHKVDFLLADDAFQHRRLHRDLDVVLLDATEKIENYSLLPKGRAREEFSGLGRADFVVLNKTNIAGRDQVKRLKEFVASHFEFDSERLFECNIQITDFIDVVSGKGAAVDRAQPVVLLSAIGQPQAFARSLTQQGYAVKHHFVFSDHYEYKASDIDSVLAEYKDCAIVTTEKDAIKLKSFDFGQRQVVYGRLQMIFSMDISRLYEDIIRLAR